MAGKVVSNTGPLMHLSEIDLVEALTAFQEVCIAEEVKNELKRNKISEDVLKGATLVNLKGKFKDVAEVLVNKFSLDLGEAQSIALALQERVDYFLTDDLDARKVAAAHNIEAHGTVGIILRAFREKIISREKTAEKVKELYTKSSLFITKPLINEVIKSIEGFKKR